MVIISTLKLERDWHIKTNKKNNEQENLITRITQLEQKFQQSEDIEEIEKLKTRYFRFVDEKNWGGLGNLFATDATLISQGQDFSAGGGQAYEKMIGDHGEKHLRSTMDICPRLKWLTKLTPRVFGLWRRLRGITVMGNIERCTEKKMAPGKSAAPSKRESG